MHVQVYGLILQVGGRTGVITVSINGGVSVVFYLRLGATCKLLLLAPENIISEVCSDNKAIEAIVHGTTF